jgi:acetyl esterase/lipase
MRPSAAALSAALGVLGCFVGIPLGAGAAESPRHLIYLHGRIVQEQQSARPQHPRFGHYELAQILDTLRARGFVVSGEIRPRSVSVGDAADRVVEQVRGLLASGVPADRITVVGASMGGGIALVASARLQNPELRFVVLGACLSETAERLVADEGKGPRGRVLSIHEASDEYTTSCPPWSDDLAPSPIHTREIVLKTGLEHGFLYRPLPEWVDPVVEWAGAH